MLLSAPSSFRYRCFLVWYITYWVQFCLCLGLRNLKLWSCRYLWQLKFLDHLAVFCHLFDWGLFGTFIARRSISSRSTNGSWSHAWMCEDATIAWQAHAGLLIFRLHWHQRVVHQRLTNVLVIHLVLLADVQMFNDRSARDLRHLSELIMMVVVGRTDIWLASSKSSLHFDIEETIGHSKPFLLCCKVFNLLFSWL